MKTTFINARIVTPDQVLEDHCMTVADGYIERIWRGKSPAASTCGQRGERRNFAESRSAGRMIADGRPADERTSCETVVDVRGAYLLPGFIDIHSDMIEGLLQPRSTAMMDFETGLWEAEKQLAACGITTIFHSVSMFREGSWDAREIRTAPRVRELADLIDAMRKKPGLIHNRYHLRYEMDNLECYGLVTELMRQGKVQMLSLMDHRPGQGQYRDLNVYRRHLPSAGKDLTDGEFAELVKRETEKPMLTGEKLFCLAELARQLGIPLSSHDDDSLERVAENERLGVSVSEFPISMEVAGAARERGIAILLGAPNILLGGSHSGNLSAEEAIRRGCADILCSDYYPQALLRAVFCLAEKQVVPLYEACRFVSLNPARAAGLSRETGSLEKGKQADFLIVEAEGYSRPRLLQTWVSGRAAMELNYGGLCTGPGGQDRAGEQSGPGGQDEAGEDRVREKGDVTG